MMGHPTECSRCHGPMEAGFVMDRGHGNERNEQEWVEGDLEKSFWLGVRTKGREHLQTARLATSFLRLLAT